MNYELKQTGDNKVIIYNTPDGETTVRVNLDGDTVWLSQQQMAVLFDKDRTVITRHINNIYKTKELEKNSTCAFFAQVRDEGGKRIADNALVALTLMIAESRTEEKDTIVKVIVNLINKNNR